MGGVVQFAMSNFTLRMASVAIAILGNIWLVPCEGAQPQTDSVPAALDGLIDCYGDILPSGAIGRLGTVRLRHRDANWISQVEFSPNGRILATANGYSPYLPAFGLEQGPPRVRLWDVATGKLTAPPLATDAGKFPSFSFLPDGKTLLCTGAWGTLRLWDIAT